VKVTAASLLPVSAARQAARESALITFLAWLSFSFSRRILPQSLMHNQSVLPINLDSCLSVLLVYWFLLIRYWQKPAEKRP
jgi:hypothetical protein